MDYLEYFDLASEPFSNAPLSRFYYASRQHTEALERLRYAANTMKGLAILIGDIGLGKTTLARRMLEALPEEEYEAAMLVIVHAGITANWLLKRIAIQLGVPDPAEDKLTILSQLYQRLVQIHESGKRAVVLIDEAQMLATRELMEEFRGLLNLEVPERKLISFIFFGLPEIERNLRLDPPLAQRIALRFHMKPLGHDDTLAYVEHRLSLAGGGGREFFAPAALEEVFRFTRGVPRLLNTLCDNLLLEMFFGRTQVAEADLVVEVANNLGFGKDFDVSSLDAEAEPERPEDPLAVEGGLGFDAIVAVDPSQGDTPAVETPGVEPEPAVAAPLIEPETIAAQVAQEPFVDEQVDLEYAHEAAAELAEDESDGATSGQPVIEGAQGGGSLPEHSPDQGPPPVPLGQREERTTVDIDDPLAFLGPSVVARNSDQPSPWQTDDIEIEVVEDDDDVPEIAVEGNAPEIEVVADDDDVPEIEVVEDEGNVSEIVPSDLEIVEDGIDSIEVEIDTGTEPADSELSSEPHFEIAADPETGPFGDESKAKYDITPMDLDPEATPTLVGAPAVAEVGAPQVPGMLEVIPAPEELIETEDATVEVEVEVSAPIEPATPVDAPMEGLPAQVDPPMESPQKGKKVDLSEIDALLADIDQTLAKR